MRDRERFTVLLSFHIRWELSNECYIHYWLSQVAWKPTHPVPDDKSGSAMRDVVSFWMGCLFSETETACFCYAHRCGNSRLIYCVESSRGFRHAKQCCLSLRVMWWCIVYGCGLIIWWNSKFTNLYLPLSYNFQYKSTKNFVDCSIGQPVPFTNVFDSSPVPATLTTLAWIDRTADCHRPG